MDLSLEIKKEKTRSRPKKSEVDRLCCDNKKIIKLTKWKPNYSLMKIKENHRLVQRFS